ncbi:hypothetical protein [Bradyrhizobium sp. NAS80.1]|uniref:hypothetical protein n=1 Tax=Bradyrhizobium sp. NAS80.1 TaxID=1680159 RepID=UPI000AFA6550|nr:hypothetical protein [Bradyrhizobium sp. NAS80.1]
MAANAFDTESVWIATCVFDKTNAMVATMLLNMATVRDSYAAYEVRVSAAVCGGAVVLLIIPGRAQREPGIHSTSYSVARWIPGSTLARRPGMTAKRASPPLIL